ncbi:hypothetical protein AAFF_G00214450 [Aldrovandia affinis]|uniref:Uncharacterized protein n=1 Tax=Aldrovandia affinis TaxID=143900 RepID=A0AAD7RGZ3_9TELE|nr:hypothetical protein AAFF_G00214450 [Aldrovandia affinis]
MEKLALTLLLLTRSQALSEASTDLVGKAFIFPGESLAHVALVPALNNTFLTVTSYTKGMNFRKGNVINWEDLEYTTYGKVVVGELQTQCSETCSMRP